MIPHCKVLIPIIYILSLIEGIYLIPNTLHYINPQEFQPKTTSSPFRLSVYDCFRKDDDDDDKPPDYVLTTIITRQGGGVKGGAAMHSEKKALFRSSLLHTWAHPLCQPYIHQNASIIHDCARRPLYVDIIRRLQASMALHTPLKLNKKKQELKEEEYRDDDDTIHIPC